MNHGRRRDNKAITATARYLAIQQNTFYGVYKANFVFILNINKPMQISFNLFTSSDHFTNTFFDDLTIVSRIVCQLNEVKVKKITQGNKCLCCPIAFSIAISTQLFYRKESKYSPVGRLAEQLRICWDFSIPFIQDILISPTPNVHLNLIKRFFHKIRD